MTINSTHTHAAPLSFRSLLPHTRTKYNIQRNIKVGVKRHLFLVQNIKARKVSLGYSVSLLYIKNMKQNRMKSIFFSLFGLPTTDSYDNIHFSGTQAKSSQFSNKETILSVKRDRMRPPLLPRVKPRDIMCGTVPKILFSFQICFSGRACVVQRTKKNFELPPARNQSRETSFFRSMKRRQD